MSRTSVTLSLAALLLSAGACSQDPVAWTLPVLVTPTPVPGRQLRVSAAGRTSFVPPPAEPAFAPPPPACPGSVRFARGEGQDVFAAWWAVRSDSSVVLLAARSPDGGTTWEKPLTVDGRDAGVIGCNRPPLAITADSRVGYVYLAYFLQPPEGAGVFFCHSMERGTMYHSPMVVVYGAIPSTTAIAAHGDTVAVAFEDPNSEDHAASLALSHTTGHLFGVIDLRIGGGRGTTGLQVATAGPWVALAWREIGYTPVLDTALAGSQPPAPATPPVTIVRTGRMR